MKYFLFVGMLGVSLGLFAQKPIFPKPLSERIANYTIDVSLDTEKKTLTGYEKLRWKNTSNDVISELQFHLYLNAFKNKNSTFMKESGGRLRSDVMNDKEAMNWGNIYVTSFKTESGENLYPRMRYIQPDDLNTNDQTVMSVRLDKPVKPGEEIVLHLQFKAKLPKLFARTGFAPDDYYLVGQWFPKIGVYESAGERYATKGQWNTHQFHAHTEFYADFGNYDVTINAPADLTIGATGVLVSESLVSDNQKKWHFYAEDVHDFAWTASPKFIVKELPWKNVKIRVFLQPEHKHLAERYFVAAETGLEYFEKTMGTYPYPTLTIVDPPLNGSGSGGMEYPTFITGGSYWGIGKWGKLQEIVTVHEFGHQYFQGMLASNEFEESWLDEGFNQYMEGRIMDETFGNGSQFNLLGFKVGDVATSRQSYVSMKNPEITQVYRNAWQYPSGTYNIMTYTKTATWMRTLENLIGRKVMDEILRTYFQRWKFKHPAGKDFIAIVNEIVPKRLGNKFGKDMNWYFKQVLYTAPTCDYTVESITNSGRKEEPKGSFTVERLGNMEIPTEIAVVFEDGSQKLIQWNGEDRSKSFSYDLRIKSVSLDPQRKNLMDLNLINNSKTISESKGVYWKYSAKFLFFVQNLMLWLSGLI